jgi:hypothetical protein
MKSLINSFNKPITLQNILQDSDSSDDPILINKELTKEDIFKDDSSSQDEAQEERLRTLSQLTKQDLDIFKDDSDDSVEAAQPMSDCKNILQQVEMNEKMNEACSKHSSMLSQEP